MRQAARDVFGSEEGKARIAAAIDAAHQVLQTTSATREQRNAMLAEASAVEAGPVRKALEKAAAMVSEEVLNTAQLVAQFRIEVATFAQDFHLAEGPRRSVYARSLLLTLYASTQSLCGMTGRTFRDEIIRTLGDGATPTLNATGKAINKTFDEVRQRFGLVRNKLAAHRDAYAFVHGLALSSEDEDAIVALAVEVLPPLQRLEVLHGAYMGVICNRLAAWAAGGRE